MTDTLRVLQEITEERTEHERQLVNRHPWVNLFYNWMIAVLLLALLAALIGWGRGIYIEYKEEQHHEAELAEQKEREQRQLADQREKEEQERKAFEDTLDRWAKAGARQLYGIRNFIELYNYSEQDLVTYLRCSWNRYLSDNGLTDLATVIYKEGQFVSCYKNNRVLTEYEDLARKCFAEWHEETSLPCDPSYVFAELKPDGIFLKRNYIADGYERRWRAGQ